jgi:pimeloyl-ACP methyl ester carboxylesterase
MSFHTLHTVAHCVALDLIGFGQSGKPDIECRVADHVRYLDAFLDHAKIESAFVVAQDWGTAWHFFWPPAGLSLFAGWHLWSS